MRTAMAAYVTGVHESYVQTASILPPAVRGSLPLLQGHFTVVAAGVGNLHVIGTRETFPPPKGLEVVSEGELPEMTWTLRFFDPVVAPELGLIDETSGEPGAEVRRVLGISTHLYHLSSSPAPPSGRTTRDTPGPVSRTLTQPRRATSRPSVTSSHRRST